MDDPLRSLVSFRASPVSRAEGRPARTGKEAYLTGLPLSACPFPDHPRATAWRKGWYRAKAAAETRS